MRGIEPPRLVAIALPPDPGQDLAAGVHHRQARTQIGASDDEVNKFAAYASQTLAKEGQPGEYDQAECKSILWKALKPYEIAESYSGTREQRGKLRSITADLIGRYVKAAKLHYSSDSGGRWVRIYDEDAEKELSIFKQVLWYYVINGAALASKQFGQCRIIQELFDIFYEQLGSASMRIFPAGYRERLMKLRESGQSDTEEVRAHNCGRPDSRHDGAAGCRNVSSAHRSFAWYGDEFNRTLKFGGEHSRVEKIS